MGVNLPWAQRIFRTARHNLSKFPDGPFDGVVCLWTLMDIPDAEATLASVARVLRPEGWFVMCVTHP